PISEYGSTDSRAGGIQSNGGKLSLTDSEVYGNKSDTDGGGILLEGDAGVDGVGVGEGFIVNSIIKDNEARVNPYSHRGEGGGIQAFIYAALTIYGGEIRDNVVHRFDNLYGQKSVYRYGGGVHVQQTGAAPVTAVFRMVKFEHNKIDDNFEGPLEVSGEGTSYGLPEGLNHHFGNSKGLATNIDMEFN